MRPGRRALQAAQQQQLDDAPRLTVEPAVVASVVGAAVSVTWRTTTFRVAYPDNLTGLAAGQTVQLMVVPGGVPFIVARLTGF